VRILVDIEELKKIEQQEKVKLKRLKKSEVKWLVPPDWDQQKLDALVVEVPDGMAPQVFEKYKVKFLRKIK
jgi:hypothetical protein